MRDSAVAVETIYLFAPLLTESVALHCRRYEDNFDAVNNLFVLIQTTDKQNIKDFGDTEKFLQQISYLLGKQAYSGEKRDACFSGLLILNP